MQFDKSDLAGLLTPAPQRAPAGQQQPATGRALNVPYLRACCATLWRRVPTLELTKKASRDKMLELLGWLAQKHGWTLIENAPQDYPSQGVKVAGRVHAAIVQGRTAIVLEICFDLQEPVLRKLLAAHRQGRQVLMLWAGAPLPETALAARLDTLLAGRGGDWLTVYQLNAN